jgi:hypothetical protein
MCGIFSLLNNNELFFPRQFIDDQFKKGVGRGPEYSTLTNVNVKALFGFHRLAINGLNSESNQPIKYNDITLICNGEIYNYRELYKEMGIKPTTDSDCEVIIHLYLKYGIEHTLQMLDGVFSFLLLDGRYNLHITKLYIARDPYGVRPLFWLRNKDPESPDRTYGFASELKMLSPFYSKLRQKYARKQRRMTIMETNIENNTESFDNCPFVLEPFQPGTYAAFDLPWTVNADWKLTNTITYHSTGFNSNILTKIEFDSIFSINSGRSLLDLSNVILSDEKIILLLFDSFIILDLFILDLFFLDLFFLKLVLDSSRSISQASSAFGKSIVCISGTISPEIS